MRTEFKVGVKYLTASEISLDGSVQGHSRPGVRFG
jgi:hypothetical protein